MPGHRKAEIKPSLKGIAGALNSSTDVVEEPLPEKLAALSERLTKTSHPESTSKLGIGRVQTTLPCAKGAAELEGMIIADCNMTDMADPSISSGSELWEPMETAPLDGTPIRVRSENAEACVSWATALGAWVIGLATEPNATDRILPWRPTAWAPVPGALE